MDNNFNNDLYGTNNTASQTENGMQPGQGGQYSQNVQYQQTAAYTPAPNYVPYQPQGEEPVSLGDWIGTLLLFKLVPCVGLIVYIVWAFSKDTKTSKKNFCRAQLIIYAVSIVLVVLLYVFIFGAIFASGAFDGLMM